MPSNIYVASTTDTQAEVDAAAEYGQQTLPLTEEEKPAGPSEVEETETVAAQEPAEEPENQEEEEEAEEPEPSEAAQAKPAEGESKRQLRAQVARLMSQMSDMREELRQLKQPPQPLSAQPPKPDYSRRPDENDPKYVGKYGDFVADMTRHTNWVEAQEKATSDLEELQRQVTVEDQKLQVNYNEQVNQAVEKYKDWLDTVRPLQEALPPLARDTITRMRNGAEVAYRIGKDPEFAQQLVDWGAPEQVRGEGGINIIASLKQLGDEVSSPSSSPSSRSPQPRSAAPKPLRRVGGAAMTTTAPTDPDKMTMKEFNQWRDSGGGR